MYLFLFPFPWLKTVELFYFSLSGIFWKYKRNKITRKVEIYFHKMIENGIIYMYICIYTIKDEKKKCHAHIKHSCYSIDAFPPYL